MPAYFGAMAFAIVAAVGLAGEPPAAEKAKETPGDPPAAKAPAKPDSETKDSSETEKPKKSRGRTEKATFGGGCFWSIEAIFERVPGVKSVTSGFSGGTVPFPSYDMVCTGMTGHAEVVQVEYDPDLVPYERLLTVFWAAHNPTTLNFQGDDFGPQYRSAIFYHTDEQKRAALKSYRDLTARRVFRSPIVTELMPFTAFYPAEPYHQDYFRNHPYSDYTHSYIIPKLRKLRTKLKLR